nr:MAG TPA: hypothetical protein [Caudoviricetes sp.]
MLHPFQTAIQDNPQALQAQHPISVAWSTFVGCTTSLAISRFHLLVNLIYLYWYYIIPNHTCQLIY